MLNLLFKFSNIIQGEKSTGREGKIYLIYDGKDADFHNFLKFEFYS